MSSYSADWHRNKYQTDPDVRDAKLQRNEEWRKNNQGKINDASRRLRYKKKLERIEYLGGKCVGCGECNPDLLQFDHIDRSKKEFNISKKCDLVLEKIIPELDKCQLLCNTCHAIKTRSNQDNNEILKGYKITSIDTTDDQIVITYAKTDLL